MPCLWPLATAPSVLVMRISMYNRPFALTRLNPPSLCLSALLPPLCISLCYQHRNLPGLYAAVPVRLRPLRLVLAVLLTFTLHDE